MLVEAKTIALMQAGEIATQSQDSSLHTDGITKFGRKYSGFQVTTDDQSLSLGMADMMSGSAEHTFDTFEAILKDAEMACKTGLGMNNVVVQVVNSLKNTMSDRHIVEKKIQCLSGEVPQRALACDSTKLA